MKKVKVAIIGAGTSGLTARREVARTTDDYVIIDDGPLGTTCARVGCMPSKVLIQVANDFYRRKSLDQEGILGGDGLSIDTQLVMKHVRSLRDRFVRAVLSPMEDWQSKFIAGRAQFVDAHTVEVNGDQIQADKIIVATGSRPIIPDAWQDYRQHLITTDQFFELPELPQSMAVFGLGVIGIELGQALHRLGVQVVGVTRGKRIGGLTDPVLQNYVAEKLTKEMCINFEGAQISGVSSSGLLQVLANGETVEVEKALVSIGRRSNVDRVSIEKAGVQINQDGLPSFDENTMALIDAPHIFFPGDTNGDRPILHEAADEGFIAGYNASQQSPECFKRRVALGVTFCDPNIAVVGKNHKELTEDGVDFVTGEVSFEGQGRSIVKLKEQGILHVYADRKTYKVLGAELHAPDGEHLAHLLAWAISTDLTVDEVLKMPFYHPVIEEGLRTAMRDAADKLGLRGGAELYRCQDLPIR